MLFILSSGWSAADGGLILGPQSRSRTLGALNHGDKRDALVMSRPSFISLPVSANGLLLFSHSSYVQLFETPWTAAHQGFPVHQLPECAQTHVHQGDAIQPSFPLSSPSPSTLSLSQH